MLDALKHSQARVYATEQTSAFYLALRRRVARLHGSEFGVGLRQRMHLALWLLRKGVPPWIRSEDVTALRWSDATMDGVVSLDVLEHVPDYRAALREFARVLRPGGALALTVPFYEYQSENVRIARLDARGRIEHLGEPEFHGDPIRGGVPCFHHFGWALLDDMREAGFADAQACRVQDPSSGLPQGQWVLLARR
ncbi:methyltransferase domain-containing protein [Luteimonas gilva]|uniref:Methyltransferase domain-containing protein n=1 Tax=Luteimonas gilva TaxID=2572684 RepID=A0A4U5JM86_9GAMM|nr:class I SAM-dependent methyltransferase [Luteimonas gilva]TKR30780.1 methyltransferase domain-containing protein [Luteimonas gilva]